MSAINTRTDFQTITRAVVNDGEIKALTFKLAELYQKSMPTIVLKDGKAQMSYDPQVETLANKIKILIEQRKEQIIKANVL